MAILYQDDLFVVKQSFFGSWRVTIRENGVTIAPDLRLQEQVGLVWPKIRQRKDIDPNLRRFAEDVMFQIFAIAAIDPKGEAGLLFSQTGADAIAHSMVVEAGERLKFAGIRPNGFL